MLWRKIGAAALVLLASALQAQSKDLGEGAGTFALRAKWIYTLAEREGLPPVLEDGVLIVKNGRIHAVGKDLDIPEGIPVIDCSDGVLVPGFVAANTNLVPSRGGEETVSAKYRALDGFDWYGEYREALAGGVTTAYLNPGRTRLVSGTGAVVKLAGSPGPGRVLRDGGDLYINFGPQVLSTPSLQEYPLPASSANEIPPGKPQRPSTRLGLTMEIRETFARARAFHNAGPSGSTAQAFDFNLEILGAALAQDPVLCFDASRVENIEAAVKMLKELGMRGYLSGAAESHRIVPYLKSARLPVVIEVPVSLNRPAQDIGMDLDPPETSFETAARLSEAGIPFALMAPYSERVGDIMLAAAAAVRGGLCPMKALEAITRTPAEILGVGDRVGSLAPGRDADFLVLSGMPLKVRTHVLKVFSSGIEVFSHPDSGDHLVVRAGRILTAAGPAIVNGEILVEKGKISAVGSTVPHPPGTRFLDAGPDAVITPGFVDGHGHLGLEGDRTAPGTDVPIAQAIAVPGRHFREVARSGITTVILAPYGASAQGSQVAAIKTQGARSSDLVVDGLAALKFSFRGRDPILNVDSLRSALKAGKAYTDSWTKYYEDLKKWKEEEAKKAKEPKDAAGEKKEEKKATEEVVEEKVEQTVVDPITGTWQYTVQGGPLPEPRQGTLKLKLEGTAISGSGSFMFRRGGDELPLS